MSNTGRPTILQDATYTALLCSTVSFARTAIADEIFCLSFEAGGQCLSVDDVQRLLVIRKLFELHDEVGLVLEVLAAFLRVAQLLQSSNQSGRLRRDFSARFAHGLAFLQVLFQFDRFLAQLVPHFAKTDRLQRCPRVEPDYQSSPYKQHSTFCCTLDFTRLGMGTFEKLMRC